jgi:glutaredoxin
MFIVLFADLSPLKADFTKIGLVVKTGSRSHASETVKLRINTYADVTYDTSSFDVGKKVIMYSANWCGVCKKARRYFEKQGIDYKEYDVETSARGKSDYKKLGAKGVPVILVGKQRMNGFSVDGFEKLYR